MQEEEKRTRHKLGDPLSVKERLFRRAKRAEQFAARRTDNGAGTTTQVVMQSNVKARRKPAKFQQVIEYDFLQYIRIVYKWALENYELTRGEIDLLLYLNPIGIFTKSDFHLFHKTIGLYANKTFQKLEKEGWIIMWRERKHQQKALYTLSQKGKLLCSNMHRMCVGEKEIPLTRNNAMTDGSKVINKYYLKIIKSMSKKKEKPQPE